MIDIDRGARRRSHHRAPLARRTPPPPKRPRPARRPPGAVRHARYQKHNASALRKRTPSRPPRIYRAGHSSRRLVAVFVITAVLFVAVLLRVTLLQTVDAGSLRLAGKEQRTTEMALKAHRGTIFDRQGEDLALSVPARTIIANPKLVLDPAGTVRTLTALLKLPDSKQRSLTEAFAQKKSSFVYVARQIDPQLAASVVDLRLAGVSSISEDQRLLPGGDVAKSIVGRTDPDLRGTAGLELEYDALLRGTDGRQQTEHDRKFRSIAGGDETVAPVPGSDIVTTIDRGLQYQVEQALLQRVDVLKASGGTAIVMGSRTGDLLSIANVRRDDAGTAQVTAANLAAVEPHEPGSVAKVFSIAAAVNEGLATPQTTINVPGFLVYRPKNKSDDQWKFKIRDAEPHNEEPMSLRDIIVHSSNIGTVLMTEGLGTLRFGRYLHEFGFGSTTGLGLPDESAGIVKPAADWQATEKVTPRYGYGYATTSLQLIAAVNTIANAGTYVAPRLVLQTIDARGVTHDSPASPTHEVVTPQTATTMTSMMKDVLCYGTATYAKVPGMPVAGKTGTALLKSTAKPGDQPEQASAMDTTTTTTTLDPSAAQTDYQAGDGSKAYYSTFVGYFPADDPQVTILVSIDRPDPSSQDRFGGKAAGPLFSTLATIAMHELRISPMADDGCQSSQG